MMGLESGELEHDITRNLRTIEWLRAEIVASVGALLKAMVAGSEELILDALASIIIAVQCLGRHLGIPLHRLHLKIAEKLRQGILDEHQLEVWYGDLSALKEHWEWQKR